MTPFLNRLGLDRTPLVFICSFAVFWFVFQLISRPGLDSYGDMVEVYAWSQHWLLGSDKHPQFLPWITKVWFWFFPKTVWSFYLLTAGVLITGLYGIMHLGKALKLNQQQVMIALALQVLASPYLTLSAKLNMNSILLAVWPWVAVAFIHMAQSSGRAQIRWAMALGILASLAMMSKYVSLVLLLSLAILTLLPGSRSIWKTKAPYVALISFVLTLLPHLIWTISHPDGLGFASAQGRGDINITRVFRFALLPIGYWLIPLILVLIGLFHGQVYKRLWSLIRWSRGDIRLWVLAFCPLFLSLLFGIIGFVELSSPWLIPMGFAYTLLWVQNGGTPKGWITSLPRISPLIWLGLLILALIYAVFQAVNEDDWYYAPEAAAGVAVHEGWAMRGDDTPSLELRWVAPGNDAARLAYFAQSPLEALPTLPDSLPSYYPKVENWVRQGGFITCGLVKESLIENKQGCISDALAWAAAHNLNAQEYAKSVRRSGFRFPRNVTYISVGVYVWPNLNRP